MLIGRWYGGRSLMRWPSSSMLPLVGVSNPPRQRSSVDLPLPEPPSRAKISPLRTSKLTSSSATKPSNSLRSARMDR